ncbi:MAG: ABC transporter substrate-binding protein [Victivallaceae bacterium]|nr:ABC transporter substrate-binding protein [Victivallaceae bacterium]
MKKFRIGLVSAASVLALFFSGCEKILLRIDPQKPELGPVGVALVTPLSGENSVFGKQMLRGAQIAVEDLNRGRGINRRPVRLIVVDSAVSTDPVREAAEQGAVALVAGYNTVDVSALVNSAEDNMLPTVIPLATDDRHLGINPFIFRNAYTDSQQAETISGYLWYWQQMMRIGVMIDMASGAEYERNIARGVAQAFQDLGGETIVSAEYNGDDFEAAVDQVISANPQAVTVPAPGKRSAKIILSLRRKGYRGLICGPDSWDDEDLLRGLDGARDIGRCIFISFFTEKNPSEESRNFRTTFLEHFDYEPGACETQTFDAFKMLCIALNNARTLEDFTDNWMKFHNYFGAAAVYTMLPGGDIDRTLYISEVVVGKTPYPCFRLLRRLQYSKIKSYRND